MIYLTHIGDDTQEIKPYVSKKTSIFSDFYIWSNAVTHSHKHTWLCGAHWGLRADWFTAQCFSAFWTQVSNQRISCSFPCQNPHSNPSHFVHTVAHIPLKHLSVCMKERDRKRDTETERDLGSPGKCAFLVSWVALLKPIKCIMTIFKFFLIVFTKE